MKRYNVTVNGETREYDEETTLGRISEDFKNKYKYDIILAVCNGKLAELFKTVQEDCDVEFITVAEKAGMDTYTRGLILLMLSAMQNVCGDKGYSIRVEHSLGDGLYCEAEGELDIDEAVLLKVKEEMQRLVEADIPFEKQTLNTTKVREMFRERGLYDKERLLGFRRVSKTNVYTFDGYMDYFYGYMPASSGILKYFDLFKYNKGFILLRPNGKNPTTLKEIEGRKKLFALLQETNKWCKTMGISTVADLNAEIAKGNINNLILVQEALAEKKIGDIAEKIKLAGNKKFIMIAGPSSSGKTTFSHRLSIQLMTLGYKPHPIAVDDYYIDRDKLPVEEDGTQDYEALSAIDIEQFNKDMNALLRGETVEIPSYNFKTGKREYKGNYKKLGEDDLLVIEGIHCLNDALSHSLPKESKYKIYISALTQINIDEHNRIPTTEGRLLRRMVRDARTRGTSAQGTISRWPSVRHGEDEYIFPFQEEADAMFNSTLIYEMAVIKQYAESLLFGIKEDEPEYFEARRLLKFLDYFLGVTSENIPQNSILREFIGGGCFNL